MPAPLRDSPCLCCGKLFTRKSVYEHERHSCRHSPKRVKRSYGKKKCAICGKSYHAAGLRAHMATQHPHAFIIAEKESRKPSSRAARRRELVARADSSRARAKRQHEQQPEKRKESRERSPPQHTPRRRSEESRPSLPAEPRTGKHTQAHRSKEGHADGSASKRAWSVMRQKMSEAASR